MRKRRQCVVILVSVLYIFASGCMEKNPTTLYDSSAEEESVIANVKDSGENPKTQICVYVCGQVLYPGVYELDQDARVAEAIESAGGMTEEAAETYLNQAAFLEDGQKVYVPTKEEAVQEAEKSEQEGKINLNTADEDALMSLSGIGSAKAEAIIAYREEKGGFHSIEEVMNIEGIKEGVFQKIKDKITVE